MSKIRYETCYDHSINLSLRGPASQTREEFQADYQLLFDRLTKAGIYFERQTIELGGRKEEIGEEYYDGTRAEILYFPINPGSTMQQIYQKIFAVIPFPLE